MENINIDKYLYKLSLFNFSIEQKRALLRLAFVDGQFDDSALKEAIDKLNKEKQDNLVSGETIKTINGESILGKGNIDITGGPGGGIPDAPKDDKLYGRENGTWKPINNNDWNDLGVGYIPQWFKDSAVCIYDVERQGCTNESLKAVPKLHDFTPNGLDAELKNFAFKGMSGVNGYKFDFLDTARISVNSTLVKPLTHSIAILKNIKNQSALFEQTIKPDSNKIINETVGGFILKINEMNNISSLTIRCQYREEPNGILKQITIIDNITEKGIYKTKEHNINIGGISYINTITCITTNDDNLLSLEILPNYPGGLVFDGIDDYVISKDQPILTDYTLIAKRLHFNYNNIYFCHKGTENGNPNLASFIIDYRPRINYKNKVTSFGVENLLTNLDINSKNIIVQTKNNYNDIYINSGNIKDNDILIIGNLQWWTAKFKGVFYQLLLFNRTLNAEEINWVKKHIMGEENINNEIK